MLLTNESYINYASLFVDTLYKKKEYLQTLLKLIIILLMEHNNNVIFNPISEMPFHEHFFYQDTSLN